MEPFGEGCGDQHETGGKRELEDRFKEKVAKKAKRVRFTLPEGHVDRTTTPPSTPRDFDPARPQTLTGARNTRLQDVPKTGKHPLSKGQANELEDGSYRLAERTDDTFRGGYKQPGMAGTLLTGDTLSAHTSMKGGATPNVHPAVQTLLDELDGKVRSGEGVKGKGHGRCAEIGTISDYLWNVDKGGTMGVDAARAHFEYVGAATAAHDTHPDGRGRFYLRPACDTCAYVTQRLAIASLKEEY